MQNLHESWNHTKGQVDVKHIIYIYIIIFFFLQNALDLRITTENKNIILKAYSAQKVGSGGNFESGNQVNGTGIPEIIFSLWKERQKSESRGGKSLFSKREKLTATY